MKTRFRKLLFKKIIAGSLCVALFFSDLPYQWLTKDVNASIIEEASKMKTSENELLEKEKKIVKEVEELRDEYTKTYEKSDGSMVAVSAAKPLHFLDEDGKYITKV